MTVPTLDMMTTLAAVPEIDGRYVCIVDRESVALAAVVSSYFAKPGHYFPLFGFPGIEHPDRGQDDLEDDDYVAKMVGSEAAIKLSNVLARIRAEGCVVLAGLTAEQKSYLKLPDALKIVEIAGLDDAHDILAGIAPREGPTLLCNRSQVHLGLLHALVSGATLTIKDDAPVLSDAGTDTAGLVVIEATQDHFASVVAVNYAYAVGASVRFVAAIDRREQRRVFGFLQAWKDGGDETARDALFAEIDGRVGSLDWMRYDFVTFFTDGLPYTLRSNGSGVHTYVNLSNHADHFVVNGILAETEEQLPAAVVFTIDEFLNNGEAKSVSAELEQGRFWVRALSGLGATGFSFGYHAEHFPYGVFHVVSHGGEIDGNTVIEEFTDREGVVHVVEYDEVVGIHRVLTEGDRFAVQRKVIFKAIDGIDWNSDERTHDKIPHYVYEDMRKQIFATGTWGKGAKRTPKRNVPLSCSVKCNDGIHQAMFRTVGGYGSPLIFNNTCWSWWGIADFFVSGGARAYLGTLWSVHDSAAVMAAEAFYDKAPGGNIAGAVREASRAVAGTDDARIYALWGLHFSTLSNGQSIERSTHAVCERLARLLKMYGRFLESGATEDDARDNAIEALELLDQDFDALCDGPAVVALRARVAQTLSKVGPKKRYRR